MEYLFSKNKDICQSFYPFKLLVGSYSNQPLLLFKQIVEVVLRQGLVHPITCVPSLIALETDPEEVNSKLAHHLLMNMNEKYTLFIVRI